MPNYRRTKLVCYYTYLAMSSVFSLPPLLFSVFQELYHVSYTLLGTLVLVNFCTQLTIDLIFSFFASRFNFAKTLRITPLITAFGLVAYALIPFLFPQRAYLGLLIGTVLFSVAAGLGEVLVSPTIAALPSDTPEKDMSTLHSLYAYGFITVVIVSTLFLHFCGRKNWVWLTMFWAVLPVIASILLMKSPIPPMKVEGENAGGGKKSRGAGILLLVACIFFGSAAENAMTNWISVYMESAVKLPKVWGDLIGMTSFALLLGLTRTIYAKYGKNIYTILFIGMSGAFVLYLIVVFSPSAILSVLACIVMGVFTSMLWPGTLIYMEEVMPGPGVAAYALMAAGGDCGASVAPQLLGAVVDQAAASGWIQGMAERMNVTSGQLAMKTGMLTASVFPLIGVFVLLILRKRFAKKAEE